MATLVFASGTPLPPPRLAHGLEAAREVLEAHELRWQAGVTSPNPQVMVLRVLAPVTEPAVQLLKQVWVAWRRAMWQMSGTAPRLWNL
jgi:urease accessory protein